jgi:hypothetical protein
VLAIGRPWFAVPQLYAAGGVVKRHDGMAGGPGSKIKFASLFGATGGARGWGATGACMQVPGTTLHLTISLRHDRTKHADRSGFYYRSMGEWVAM